MSRTPVVILAVLVATAAGALRTALVVAPGVVASWAERALPIGGGAVRALLSPATAVARATMGVEAGDARTPEAAVTGAAWRFPEATRDAFRSFDGDWPPGFSASPKFESFVSTGCAPVFGCEGAARGEAKRETVRLIVCRVKPPMQSDEAGT